MTPATRSQAAARTPEGALTYVLDNVLIAGADSMIRKALTAAQTTTVIDFMELSRADLSELTFGDNNARLSVADRNKLLAVQRWYRSQEDPTIDTWFVLPQVSFQAYREQVMVGHTGSSSGYLHSVADSAAAEVVNTAATTGATVSFEEMFLKNTKRGISDYTESSDPKDI